MLFNSMQYLVFFPIVFFAYFLLPRRIRPYWLLVASYYFYMSWNAKYALLMLFSTVVTYAGGLALHAMQKRDLPAAGQKAVVAVGIVLDLGVLFWFKYLNFALQNLDRVLQIFHIQLALPVFDILLPVGISFYTFQSLGYLIDVYQEQTAAEKNFFKYALFVAFFPQLVAGPIERSENLLSQINEPREFCVADAKSGLLRMAYGLFCKIVVADNIAAVIDPLFDTYTDQNGMAMLLATALFAVQVYCDFNGYTQIAIGSARVLGFRLMENFDAPFMALNIRDFWKRWHISLTLWFQDYLYLPLAMADTRRLTRGRWEHLPPSLCIFLVFLCSGLWHGAAWHYVVWGAINGIYLAVYDAWRKRRKKQRKKGKGSTAIFMPWLSRAATFMLTVFSFLFFRVNYLSNAVFILRAIVRDFHPFYILTSGAAELFPSQKAVIILLVSIGAVIVADICRYRKISLENIVFSQPALIRWAWYITVIFVIILWGAYGDGYEQTQFIYFQF